MQEKQRHWFNPWVRKTPERRKQSAPPFLAGESHGQRRAWCATGYGVARSQTGHCILQMDTVSYRKWSCGTSGDTSLGAWTQLADSMRFSVSYGSELLPLPLIIVLSLVPVITKFLRRKSSLCFLSGRYCHSFHFMIIPEKNFLVWERSVLKDDLLWASDIPSTPLGSKPNTQSVSTLKKYKKWSRENNDLFVDGYILINEQILFAIQRFGVGSFFLMPTIK